MCCSSVNIRQAVFPRCPISRWCQFRSALKTQSSFLERQLHHLYATQSGTSTERMCERHSRNWLSRFSQNCVTPDGGIMRRMLCALGPALIKSSNHALCASWTTGIRLRNCACDCPLSANHFCTNALWPTGTHNTTSLRSSFGPSPVHASAPTESESSGLMPALFQIFVFPRFTWMPAHLKSDSLTWGKIFAAREGSQRT